MRSVNIISKDNGAGLSRNIGLLDGILRAAGWAVHVTRITERRLHRDAIQAGQQYTSRWKQARVGLRNWWESRRAARRDFTVNLFMESLLPECFAAAKFNCLVPNPEWFRPWWQQHLPQLDLVLCKTRHAESIFQSRGARTAYISFTSVDRRLNSAPAAAPGFLHIAGQSRQKGTERLLEVWRRRSEWPKLTVVQHPAIARRGESSNIDLRLEVLDDAALQALQNSHNVHLCPSETEGFGHYIVEAMSCQALVLTTDAPPMNEHITPDRGLLVQWSAMQPQCLAMNHYVDLAALEAQIETAIHMSPRRRLELGQNARAWYEGNDRLFRMQLVTVFDQLVGSTHRAA